MFLNEDMSDIDNDGNDNIQHVCSTELGKALKRLEIFIGSYCTNYREYFYTVLK